MPELTWTGIHAEIKADWKSPEILIEGSLGCGKTTVALDKEIDALQKWPGIPILLFRWTEDAVATKLKVAFDELLSIRGLTADWDAKQKVYRFPNGSLAFMFGLKAVSDIEQFNKIRGLGVSRIMGDQVEEMRRAVAGELRGRLRPNLTATVSGVRFPFQLTFVANPSNDDFWLSKEFPLTNRIKGRKVYSLSVFDNPHLPQETKDGLVRTFPPEHPKHRTMILGQRGLSVTGDAIYEGLFKRKLHVRSLAVRSSEAPLLEAYTIGKHNPCWVMAQRSYTGGLNLLGGVLAKGYALEDFVSLIERVRSEWFTDAETQVRVLSCTAPMGAPLTDASRFTLLQLLRARGIVLRSQSGGNGPAVQLAMIEYLSGLLRRRLADGEEAFGVEENPKRWLQVSADEGETEVPFIAFALEGGYTWSEHFVSVSQKELRQPNQDDEYANAMEAVEQIALNFCAGHETDAERDRHRETAMGGMEFPPFPQGPLGWMGV